MPCCTADKNNTQHKQLASMIGWTFFPFTNLPWTNHPAERRTSIAELLYTLVYTYTTQAAARQGVWRRAGWGGETWRSLTFSFHSYFWASLFFPVNSYGGGWGKYTFADCLGHRISAQSGSIPGIYYCRSSKKQNCTTG